MAKPVKGSPGVRERAVRMASASQSAAPRGAGISGKKKARSVSGPF